jgi:hypothetical protein
MVREDKMPDENESTVEGEAPAVDAVQARIDAFAQKERMIESVFRELGIPVEWDEAVFRSFDAQLRELTAESGELKAEIEVIREKRRDVIRRMEPLIMARARLIEVRPPQPGDVVVGGEA